MIINSSWRATTAMSLVVFALSSCSLDPNARKEKYFQSGQRYFEKHQYREAAVQFTNAVKIDSGYAEAHFQLAESYLNLQQMDRAYQELTRTLELRPDDLHARLALANLLILGRRFQDAQNQMEILLKKHPLDPAVHSAAASLMAAESNVTGAIAETQQTIGLDPGRWELYLSLGLLQLKNNQPDLAEATFKRVIELHSRAMEPRLLLGKFYESQKRFTEADKQFRDAWALAPGAYEPRNAVAGLYTVEGRRAEAEQILLQAKHDLPHIPDSYLALSNFYYMAGDLEKSIGEYRALYLERPKDSQIKKKFIQLLIQGKEFDEARILVGEILKTNPQDNDALVYRGQILISSGDAGQAKTTLEMVIKGDPKNSLAHYALGVALEKMGSLEHATGEWLEALRLDPDMMDAHRALAGAAIRQGDMNALQEATTQMVRLRPGSPDGYALRGLANINRKHFAEAETDIRKAIEVSPQSSIGYVQLGNLKFAEKQYGDAVSAYQQGVDRNGNSIDALRGLISVYMSQKQVDRAVAAIQAQVAKYPDSPRFLGLLGSVLFHGKGDFAGAEAAFQKAVSLDPHNSDAIVSLCQVKAAKGEVDQAIAIGEGALKEDHRQPSLFVLIGNLYSSREDWKRAEEAFQSALAIESGNPQASNGLARSILHTGGNFDVALSLAQSARKALPDSPAVADTLGWIYLKKGIYPLAVGTFQEALKLQAKGKLPENPDIHYHLGLAYEKSGQRAQARQHLEQVLKISPSYRDASAIKQELVRLRS